VVAECYGAIVQTVGQLCCSQSGSIVLELGFQLHSFVYTHIVDNIVYPFSVCAKFMCVTIYEYDYP
jgi:hypothetical protein